MVELAVLAARAGKVVEGLLVLSGDAQGLTKGLQSPICVALVEVVPTPGEVIIRKDELRGKFFAGVGFFQRTPRVGRPAVVLKHGLVRADYLWRRNVSSFPRFRWGCRRF